MLFRKCFNTEKLKGTFVRRNLKNSIVKENVLKGIYKVSQKVVPLLIGFMTLLCN